MYSLVTTLYRPIFHDVGQIIMCEQVKYSKQCTCFSGARVVCHLNVSNDPQEALMEVSRCLLDSLSQEGLSVKLTGKLAKPSASQLRAFLQQFRYVCDFSPYAFF